MTELEGVQEMLDVSLNEQVKMHKNIMDLQADLKAVAVAARTYMRYPLHTAERMTLGEALDRPRVKKILEND